MNRGCRNALILGMVLFVTIGITTILVLAATGAGGFTPRDSLAIIQIRGGIFEADSVLQEIDQYRKNNHVRAIVVRVDSPGGGVGASQEIFRALKQAREDNGKLIVVSMAGVAASGGYYVSCAADRIFAMPGTITGSIGVIATFPNMEGLNEKIGLRWNVLKTGAFKDSGSATRPMTEEDRAVMEELLFSAYDQFVNDIADRRSMDVDHVKELADGRVYTGQQALEHGLIDEEGSLLDAIEYARERTGIEGEPHILQREERQWPWFLTADVGDLLPKAAHPMRPGLYYLWP